MGGSKWLKSIEAVSFQILPVFKRFLRCFLSSCGIKAKQRVPQFRFPFLRSLLSYTPWSRVQGNGFIMFIYSVKYSMITCNIRYYEKQDKWLYNHVFQNCQILYASIVAALRQFLSWVPPGVWRFSWTLAPSTHGAICQLPVQRKQCKDSEVWHALSISSQEVNSPPWTAHFQSLWEAEGLHGFATSCQGLVMAKGGKVQFAWGKVLPACGYHSLIIVSPAKQDVGQRWSECFFLNIGTAQCLVQWLWKGRLSRFFVAQV